MYKYDIILLKDNKDYIVINNKYSMFYAGVKNEKEKFIMPIFNFT